MKRIVVGILALLLLSACGMRHARIVMDDVETYMQEFPDSARLALETLPRHSHRFPWQHARYCLLLSSALDRSGINVQDDSLARYAAEYYDRFGGPVKQFYSQYYLGRVHENRGDRESAMEAYVKAKAIDSKAVPLRFRCALEMNMGAIYAQIYEMDKAAEANALAAKYALGAGWDDNYYQATLNQARIYTVFGNLPKADSCIALLQSFESTHEISESCRMSSLGNQIARLRAKGSTPDRIQRFADSVTASHQDQNSLLPWIDFSRALVRTGRAKEALSAIRQYENYYDTTSNIAYYGILSEILDSLGDVSGSLNTYKRYITLSDSLDLVLLHQDTRFLMERYDLQMKSMRRSTIAWLIAFAALFFISVLGAILYRRKRENKKLGQLFKLLQEEYHDLQRTASRFEKVSGVAEELLGARMKALSSFFSQDVPPSLARISTQLETLTENRRELVETIGMIMAVYRPLFISLLVEKGLTAAEIGYCCLIVMGLRTGEIKDVINREGVYNISSMIRQKLGLSSNSQKLGTYLKAMYDNSQSE